MRRDREVIRRISTKRFVVEVFVEPEEINPRDTIAFGDDPEAQAAEDEYCQKIYDGVLPWVVIGVEISVNTETRWVRPHVIGAAYIGGCDFLPFSKEDPGYTRDMVREAIKDARSTAKELSRPHV